ncbi:MAG: hypothetical protein SFY81_05740 [Verrucomicrobiota bacterium]|nr:hypothetical protein [Verrucomicrobiota bacterium]
MNRNFTEYHVTISRACGNEKAVHSSKFLTPNAEPGRFYGVENEPQAASAGGEHSAPSPRREEVAEHTPANVPIQEPRQSSQDFQGTDQPAQRAENQPDQSSPPSGQESQGTDFRGRGRRGPHRGRRPRDNRRGRGPFRREDVPSQDTGSQPQQPHSYPDHRDTEHPSPRQQSPSMRAIKAQVDRIRQALEGVLRDLERVAVQLGQAEQEKEIAEEEIENLRQALNSLQRHSHSPSQGYAAHRHEQRQRPSPESEPDEED